jgi:hypothetical protein
LAVAILVPLFRGGAFFWGGDMRRMAISLLIGAAFGLGIAMLLRVLRRG